MLWVRGKVGSRVDQHGMEIKLEDHQKFILSVIEQNHIIKTGKNFTRVFRYWKFFASFIAATEELS